MELVRYEFLPYKSLYHFEFYSHGPKGKIRKFVRFSSFNLNGTKVFNLSFGDWDEKGKRINDTAVTNNNDTNIVLATVAAAVAIFTERFPDFPVYAKGRTAARTRLYQIAITMNWQIIARTLKVYGYKANKWQPFKKNVNYESFIVWRK